MWLSGSTCASRQDQIARRERDAQVSDPAGCHQPRRERSPVGAFEPPHQRAAGTEHEQRGRDREGLCGHVWRLTVLGVEVHQGQSQHRGGPHQVAAVQRGGHREHEQDQRHSAEHTDSKLVVRHEAEVPGEPDVEPLEGVQRAGEVRQRARGHVRLGSDGGAAVAQPERMETSEVREHRDHERERSGDQCRDCGSSAAHDLVAADSKHPRTRARATASTR